VSHHVFIQRALLTVDRFAEKSTHTFILSSVFLQQ